MAVTFNTVRELALNFPNVEERVIFGTPSLHVGRKLMARLREDGQTLAIKLPQAERGDYFEQNPDTFFITDHYRNYPMILVDLPTVRREIMVELVEKAWRLVASPKQIKEYDSGQSKQDEQTLG